MVIRLAESLDVPLRERNALLLSAGYAAAYGETPLEQLAPLRRALDRVLEGHLPYPAVLTDGRGLLVAANTGCDALIGGAGEPGVSVARVLLDQLGDRIVNRAQWGRHVIDALRSRGLDADELSALV